MSQAHYVRCTVCPSSAIATIWYAVRRPRPIPLCFRHLNRALDLADLADRHPRWSEPVKIEWAYDAGTRSCPLHHWPDVLCQDWAVEHAAMIRALTAPYRVPAT